MIELHINSHHKGIYCGSVHLDANEIGHLPCKIILVAIHSIFQKYLPCVMDRP